jgi:hypothetical protein
MLIFSLCISILFLVYTVLNHAGYIRSFCLRNCDMQKYIENYKDIPYAKSAKSAKDTNIANITNITNSARNRTVICFSATESQMQNLSTFLNSLLDQTIRVNDVVIAVPYTEIPKIPQKYKKILTVHGYSRNYENVANIICAVLREPEANTKIIVVSPDIIYGKDFIQTMVENSDEFPNKIVYGNSNRNIAGGILFKPKFFDENINLMGTENTCYNWIKKCTPYTDITLDYRDYIRI